MLNQAINISFLKYGLRFLSSSSRCCANHYDALGLTPRATQSEIKSAYYKLSMMYHPDKSDDQESAKKFRAITEAYEVLGNIKLKKMYDRGLIVGRTSSSNSVGFQPEPEITDPLLKFYKSHERRNVKPTMTGRTANFDYDNWQKNHYGEVLKKTRREKNISKMRVEKKIAAEQASKNESYVYIGFALLVTFVCLVAKGQSDYDQIQTPDPRRLVRDNK